MPTPLRVRQTYIKFQLRTRGGRSWAWSRISPAPPVGSRLCRLSSRPSGSDVTRRGRVSCDRHEAHDDPPPLRFEWSESGEWAGRERRQTAKSGIVTATASETVVSTSSFWRTESYSGGDRLSTDSRDSHNSPAPRTHYGCGMPVRVIYLVLSIATDSGSRDGPAVQPLQAKRRGWGVRDGSCRSPGPPLPARTSRRPEFDASRAGGVHGSARKTRCTRTVARHGQTDDIPRRPSARQPRRGRHHTGRVHVKRRGARRDRSQPCSLSQPRPGTR